MILGALSFLVAVVVLTNVLGVEGAAWGVVLGELMTMSLMFVEVRKIVPIALVKIIARPLLACLLMGMSIGILHDLGIVLRLLVSLFVFVATLAAIGGVAKEELRFLTERFV
jgi:O-antigen/teichoic acid export membrane protein